MRLKITASVVMAAAMFAATPQGRANAILELVSGTSTSSVAVGGVASLVGVTINGWTVAYANGTAYPATGTPNAPMDDLASINILGSGNAPLKIEFSANGFVEGTPATMIATYSGAALSANLVGSYATYYNSADTLLALTTLITSNNFTGATLNGTATGIVAGAIPFSLTQVITIKSGEGSLDDSLVSVPDGGATLAMLGGALTAMSFIRSKTRKQ